MVGDALAWGANRSVCHKRHVTAQTDGLIPKLTLGIHNINCTIGVDGHFDISNCGACRHILRLLGDPDLIGARRKRNARRD
jgi:hypothetical protein